MNPHDATEQAYRNGYEAGYKAAKAEIVRCKDCEHAHQYKEDGSIYCDLTSYHVEHYSFCSYGERKE